VPLFENQALGIALFSYAGRLCWGFNADWNLVPDVHTVCRRRGGIVCRTAPRRWTAAVTASDGSCPASRWSV
jgi:hypothetical protein